jgi:hypothetical protein
MAGIQIIAKNKDGEIKQDYEVSGTPDGREVKFNELKKEQDKKQNE